MALENVVGEASVQENLKQFLLVLSVSLSVVTISRALRQIREIPYTLLLAIAGACLALVDVRLISVPPEVTLFIFLPPLLFRTAWELNWPQLRREMVSLFAIAAAGVVLTVGTVAWVLVALAGLSPWIALLAGASLAATSTAPVMAVFERLGVDRHLRMLAEAGDLFTLAIAIGAFVLVTDLPPDLVEVDWWSVLGSVVTLGGVGGLVGSVLGLGLSYMLSRTDIQFLGRSLLLVASYGTYLIAEELGGSGVVAAIAAGTILGSVGTRRMTLQKQQVLGEFLGFVAFIVNSIVFLLIGDRIQFANLADNLWPVAIAIVAVWASRAIAVYGVGSLARWLFDSQIDWRQQTVLVWTGLRGSVSVALALSVPVVLVQQQNLEAVVFGVVLFTLLVQGLTTGPLLNRLGLCETCRREEYVQAIARSVAISQILDHLESDELQRRWSNSTELQTYRARLLAEKARLQLEIEHWRADYEQVQTVIASEQLRQELMAVETGVYDGFIQAGLLDSQTLLSSSVLDDLPSEKVGPTG